MNLSDYQREAQNTKSPAFYGEAVSRRIFVERVAAFMIAAQKLDEVKKALFYNKPFKNIGPANEEDRDCNTLQFHNMAGAKQDAIDLVHAIVGKATESGELVEAMMRALRDDGQRFDATNFIEEVGDGFWYDAIGLEAVSGTFEDAAGRNNRKLRTRFPNKFTERDAIHRNTDAERSVLEG